jgi:membrane-bound lytic murein transglycosylase F
MIGRVPDSIDEHEKIWFALASYNMGYGHMMDARRLTKSQGGDANAWADVKDRLPQLRQRKYYSKTRYGFARGDEALNYVENIRRYYQSIIGHIDQQTADTNDTSVDDLTVIDVPLPQPENADSAADESTSDEGDDIVELDENTLDTEQVEETAAESSPSVANDQETKGNTE